MKLKPTMVFAAILVSSVAFAEWPKEPTAFYGVPFGSSEKELKTILKGKKKKASLCMAVKGQRFCTYDLTFGNNTEEVFFSFSDDRVVIIWFNFPPERFDFYRDVFVEKYGPPTEQQKIPVQTRMGVEYLNEKLSWTGNNIMLELSKYGSKITEGAAFFYDRAYLEKKAAEKADSKKSAADDF